MRGMAASRSAPSVKMSRQQSAFAPAPALRRRRLPVCTARRTAVERWQVSKCALRLDLDKRAGKR